jgi:hypothetical protein
MGWDRHDWDIRAFDAWILPDGSSEPAAAGYRLVQCSIQDAGGAARLCLWARAGGCAQSTAMTEAQRLLEITGQ